MVNALILQGDCPCHPSRAIADIIAEELEVAGLVTSVSNTMDSLLDRDHMENVDLIVMHWHMAYMAPQQLEGLLTAVSTGTGIAGIHGFMGDAGRKIEIFHNSHAYHYMIGGHWVAHPGDDGVTYKVRIVDRDSAITAGIEDFMVSSEKYYMHVDPNIHAVAVTDYDGISMPIAWTKGYGEGRVFYHSLGHRPEIVKIPEVLRLTRQGMMWAARSNGE